MIRRSIVVLVIVLSLCSSPTVHAAPTDGLGDLLEHVPSRAMLDGGNVSYVDYRALESARPGAARPASTDEWLMLRDEGGLPFQSWLAAMAGVTADADLILSGLSRSAGQPNVTGFDFFDVDRELRFGSPPSGGAVLAGSFDPDAIASAHLARGFSATQAEGWTRICGAAGCDTGLRQDLSAIEPADPFGGALGRQQPLLASKEVLLSSADLAVLEAMRAAADEEAPSLADDARVQLMLDAIPSDASLRQALLMPTLLQLTDVDPRTLAPGAGTEAEGAVDVVALDPLPPYGLVLIADTLTADAELVQIILVYASEEAAQAAATALPSRVEATRSMRVDRTSRELLAETGVTEISARVHVDPARSGAAAVLTLDAPLAATEMPDADVPSSRSYRRVIEMVMTRDAAWLSATDAATFGAGAGDD